MIARVCNELLPSRGHCMTIRTRKLIGTVALLVFLGVYALAVMLTAVVLQVSSSKLVELGFYIVGGLAWVWPACLLVSWMQRADSPSVSTAAGTATGVTSADRRAGR